ncbi:uncharacterized protein LOC143922821 [Arctopsyche grandis]|uniref:uncharacterized protein LOC143922821 n=1 Tax=Arctopsyche grandis TaxID=121162 RepID=UPI00406D98F8
MVASLASLIFSPPCVACYYVAFRSIASRSTGSVPASTRAAFSDTVRYAETTLRALRLCTPAIFRLVRTTLRESHQTGAPYRSIEWTTELRSFLLTLLGPPTFGMRRAN